MVSPVLTGLVVLAIAHVERLVVCIWLENVCAAVSAALCLILYYAYVFLPL